MKKGFPKRSYYRQASMLALFKSIKTLFYIFLFLLFFSLEVQAQTEIDKCYNYLDAQEYQRAIESGKRAVKLYSKNVNAYFCLGMTYFKVGELKLALSSIRNAEKLATSKTDLTGIYSWLGLIYEKMGDFDNAFLYYSKSLSLAKDIGDRKAEAFMLTNIAETFRQRGEYDKALKYYEESLKLQYDEKGKAPVYNNIALVYSAKGDLKKAIEYLEKAIGIYERYGNYYSLAISLLNLVDTYREVKDFARAKTYLLDGLNRAKKMNNKYLEATAYGYLGWLYRDIGNKKSAKDYLSKAYDLFKSIGAEGYASAVLQDLMMLEKEVSK